MATDEDRVKEIRQHFKAEGLRLRLSQQEDGSWIAVYTGIPSPGTWAPGRWVPDLSGSTKLEAAQKAWAYHEGQRGRSV